MVKTIKKPKKKTLGSRSKLKKERELRVTQKLKANQKKRTDEEFKTLITRENIDQLDFEQKKTLMKQLYNLILSYPTQNFEKIHLLLLFCEDKNIKVIIKAIKFLTNLFMDILPTYKIRIKTESETQVAKSKEIDNLNKYENTLLQTYHKLLSIFDLFLKTKEKKQSVNNLQVYSISLASKLFQKYYYFNDSEFLFKLITTRICHDNPLVREVSFECLQVILSKHDNSSFYLELKFKIIKLTTHIIFNTKSRIDNCVIDLLIAHKIEFPDRESITKSREYNQKVSKKNKKNRVANNSKLTLEEKVVKSVKQEMSEYEDNIDYEAIFNYNIKILKKILLIYLEILRNRRDFPYIKQVLSGIGVLSENINVEILLDIQKNIYSFITYIIQNPKKDKIFAITALKTCLSITEKLTKDIISVEDTNLTNLCYTLLSELIEADSSSSKTKDNKSNSNVNILGSTLSRMTRDDLLDLLDLIDCVILKYRQFSIDIVAAYIKRIAILIKSLDIKAVPAFLLLIRKVLDKYPAVQSIVESEYENGEDDFFNYKINDPTLANAKQANIVCEINYVKNKYNNVKVITNLCEYCLNLDKKNVNLATLSHIDLLYDSYKLVK